jgi:hypothetical protein
MHARGNVGAYGAFFSGASVEKLKDFCRKDLASYEKPRQVVFVDAAVQCFG